MTTNHHEESLKARRRAEAERIYYSDEQLENKYAALWYDFLLNESLTKEQFRNELEALDNIAGDRKYKKPKVN